MSQLRINIDLSEDGARVVTGLNVGQGGSWHNAVHVPPAVLTAFTTWWTENVSEDQGDRLRRALNEHADQLQEDRDKAIALVSRVHEASERWFKAAHGD